jgi:hypothetical protein
VLSRLSLRERVGYVGYVMKDRAADRFGLPHVSIKPMLMRTALAFGMAVARVPAQHVHLHRLWARAR